MNLQKLRLYGIMDNPGFVHRMSNEAATMFLTRHSKNIFRSFLKKDNKRYFRITDTTRRRVENINVEEINGIKLSQLRVRDGENGIVFFSDKLHFAYSISKSSINIMVSFGELKHTVDNPEFYVSQTLIGYIYIDFFSEKTQHWINNPLDITNENGSLLSKDRFILNKCKKLVGNPDLMKATKEEYNLQGAKIILCFQTFLFLYLAKIIDSTTISVEKEQSFKDRIRGIKSHSIDIITVNTHYDENATTINPFSVSGHFRNQPIGRGRKETKLIYIDSFMKSGYIKRATKIVVGMDAGQSIEIPY